MLFVGIAALVVLGTATLVVACIALRVMRRYASLAEERMELLREGQARPTSSRNDERRGLSEELERELRARRDAERRIGLLERELAELRGGRRGSALPALTRASKDHRAATGGVAEREASPGRSARGDEGAHPTGFLETSAAKTPADGRPRDEKPRLGVRHPHPDDAGVAPAPPSERGRARSATPMGMFRKHYERYLENYQGYVELAEHLHRARDNGKVSPGSFEESHRQERLRRVNDGIARTTDRLDILEGQNPQLAADDLVSRRARVARRHSELLGRASS